MYYFEKTGYDIAHMSEEENKALLETAITEGFTTQAAIVAEDNYRKITIGDPISDTPQDNGSCYQFNDTFIEMRTPFDEMRGGFTVGIGLPLLIILCFSAAFLYMIIQSIITGKASDGETVGVEFFLFSLAMICLIIFGVNLYKKWFWVFLNLEAFVQRRILVRFNRKTRMVYLHRPKYAGGIVSLPWDEAIIRLIPMRQSIMALAVM